MGQRLLDRARLRLALMLFKIGQQLLLRFFAVEHKFLARSEGQAADITVSDARSRPDESYNLKIPFWHNAGYFIQSTESNEPRWHYLALSSPKTVTFVVVPT